MSKNSPKQNVEQLKAWTTTKVQTGGIKIKKKQSPYYNVNLNNAR
jgi:hypothetical protein